MRRHLDIGDEQDDREEHEGDAGRVRVEGPEGEERQHDRDDAHDAGQDQPGVLHLEDERERSQAEEQHRDLRIDDEVEERLEQIQGVVVGVIRKYV